MPLDDTIAAIATPLGVGGVGMVRLSGNSSKKVLNKIIKSPKSTLISHKIYHGWIHQVDEVLYSYMKGPRSYTGEDVVEISCHGGVAVVKKILEKCIRAGARQAKRGEFAKRAFLNGKMDLIQAEATISLIKAQTSEGVEKAALHLAGGLSKEIEEIREKVLSTAARIEAAIDFPEDVSIGAGKEAETIKNVLKRIGELLGTAEYGKILQEGVRLAIIGKPNVGKSSLLNKLLKEARAIVSDIPGTTRDTIEEWLNINGMPVRVIDTAGIRSASNSIEKDGMERSNREIEKADIILMLVDASSSKIDEGERALIERIKDRKVIYVLNKVDIGRKLKMSGVRISALTGEGTEKLKTEIIKKALTTDSGHKGVVLLSERQKECLIRARESLQRAIESIKIKNEIEIISIDLKEAIEALGEMVGQGVAEEIIDQIFNRFCVGK